MGELEVRYKPKKTGFKIQTSKDAAKILNVIWDDGTMFMQEMVYALFLNKSNEVIGWKRINSGALSNCIVYIKLIASIAVKTMSDKVVIAHNHPSGNLIPSDQDLFVTNELMAALDLVDVSLLDHIIVSGKKHTSMADKNWFSAKYTHKLQKVWTLPQLK